jgi:hypothetical protein
MTVKATGTGPTALRSYVWPDYDAAVLTSSVDVRPYTIGDLLYASSTTALSKLASVATGSVLVPGGVGVAPAWSASPTLTSLALGTTPATAGELRLKNTGTIMARNAANGANLQLLTLYSDNVMYLGDVNVNVVPWSGGQDLGTAGLGWRTGYFGTSVNVGTNPAAAGAVRIPNNQVIYARNAANAADVAMMYVDASDRIVLGGNDIMWGRALIALGGGAAPTLGTIGGTGPATAAQNTWMRVIDSTGAAFWVPAWK